MLTRDSLGAASTRCWRCDHAVDAADLYCRACGEGQGAALAWYYRPLWIVVLTLTALGPFAIVLIMRTPRLSPAAKWIASVALILFFAWIGWGMWVQTKAVLDML
jgi:hypothetical protein